MIKNVWIDESKDECVECGACEANLEDLEVGDLIDFIRSQQKIVQNNLSKRR